MKRKGIKSLVLACGLAAAYSNTANAIPISAGFVGTSVAKTGDAFFYQHLSFDFTGMNGFPGTLDFSKDLLGGAYIFNKDLLAAAFLPYNNQKLTAPAALGGVNRQSGLGDPFITALLRVWDQAGLGSYSSLSFTGSISFPLGYYKNPNIAGDTSRLLYPGTGNFVPTIGVTAFGQDVNLGGLAANASYSHPFSRDGFRWGDTVTYNLSYSRRIVPFDLPEGDMPVFVEGALELLGTWTGKFETSNLLNGLPANSGGNQILFAPGVAVKGIGWSVLFSYFHPITQTFNGTQPLKMSKGFLVGATWVPGA